MTKTLKRAVEKCEKDKETCAESTFWLDTDAHWRMCEADKDGGFLAKPTVSTKIQEGKIVGYLAEKFPDEAQSNQALAKDALAHASSAEDVTELVEVLAKPLQYAPELKPLSLAEVKEMHILEMLLQAGSWKAFKPWLEFRLQGTGTLFSPDKSVTGSMFLRRDSEGHTNIAVPPEFQQLQLDPAEKRIPLLKLPTKLRLLELYADAVDFYHHRKRMSFDSYLQQVKKEFRHLLNTVKIQRFENYFHADKHIRHRATEELIKFQDTTVWPQ